jgi:hypothetical protein
MIRIEVHIFAIFYFSGQGVIPKNPKIKNGKICPLAYFMNKLGQTKT